MTKCSADGAFLFLVLGGTVALASCASVQRTVSGWFPTATPTPKPVSVGAAAPRVYYAGSEGLDVYSEPSASSQAIGQLSPYEKVTRFKLERGYAYVESATSGLKGWVKNSQLIWRLPNGATPAAPAVAPAQPEEPVAPTVEEPQAPIVPEATAPATEALPTETPVPAPPPTPRPTPRGIAPSIFNPY